MLTPPPNFTSVLIQVEEEKKAKQEEWNAELDCIFQQGKMFRNCPFERSGPVTRSKANLNLPHPDQRHHCTKLSVTFLTKAWNRIPLAVKQEEKLQNVKHHLKRSIFV